MDANTIGQVIEDNFKEDKDVHEVAMYALSTLAVNDAIIRGMMTKDTELRGIPAKAFKLMRDFDNGLTMNKFWLENYKFIKFQLAMDDIKLNTLKHYYNYGELKDSKESFKQAKAILLSRCDVITKIAFLWKGLEFAEKFDLQFRIAIQLTEEHDEYFKSKGV